jgi:hypothetical protein
MSLEDLNIEETKVAEKKAATNTITVDYKDPSLKEEDDKKGEFVLPEKFKSVEDLMKSYSELEKKLSGGVVGESKDETDETNTEDKTEDTDEGGLLDGIDESDKDLEEESEDEKVNVDDVLAKVQEAFLSGEKKELNKESVDELKAAGLSDAIINSITKGWLAEKATADDTNTKAAKDFESSIYEQVGGREKYLEMFKWLNGQKNGKNDIEVFKKISKTGDETLIRREIESISSKYNLGGNTNGSTATGGDVYGIVGDYHKDLNSFRYKSDASFKASVRAKASRSNILRS